MKFCLVLACVLLIVTMCQSSGTANSDNGRSVTDLSAGGSQTDGQETDDGGEMMDTAENIVFRPYFKYKKQRIDKKRIRNPNNGVNERVDHVQKSPPPILVYDKKTGAYYPQGNYNQHSQFYPARY